MLENVLDTRRITADPLDAWRAATGRWLGASAVTADRGSPFHGSLAVGDLGVARVTAVSCSPSGLRRTPGQTGDSDPETYSVALVLRGRQTLRQDGNIARSGPRDLLLYSSSRPYELRVEAEDGTAASVAAHVPSVLLPHPEERVRTILGTRLPGDEGMGLVLVHLLTQLAADADLFRPESGPRLGMLLVDLVGALICGRLDAGGPRTEQPGDGRLFARVQAHIHRNLGDPDLTPRSVAAAHHVSVRHLQRLFQDHGQSVAAFIRQRRLEQARRDLTDPAQAHRSIHAIAARWGFPHHPAFTRTFTTVYGMPPSAYRERTQRALAG